ncbi:MAG: WD40/YVTN/BNR-like repeat-containing protein, partial [Candidatus Aminicenantaceae bacterium]
MNKRIHYGRWRTVCLAGLIFFLIQITGLSGQVLTDEDLNQFSWRHIGPFTFSGRITDFAVPHGQSKVYYVATASGGIWKTENHGISFEPVFDDYGNMSIGYIEAAPSNPDIIYVGTGEPLHARSSAHGNGMWKSTDAGKTWTHIGLEESYFIPKIAVDFQNPDVVYVAAEGKLYSNEPDCQRGLYKTEDGGETWHQVLDLKDRG